VECNTLVIYELDYKMIVDRYTDTILDDYGGYETLMQTKLSTDQSFVLERDEVIKDSALKERVKLTQN
jgi:hypothetical protein